MNKDLYIALVEYINKEIPEFVWVDYDEGQLNRTPKDVAYPAILIDISYPDTTDLQRCAQRIKAQLQLRVAFKIPGTTSGASSIGLRTKALGYMDLIDKLHRKLQHWNCNGSINPLSRMRAIPEKRNDEIKCYNIFYKTEFID